MQISFHGCCPLSAERARRHGAIWMTVISGSFLAVCLFAVAAAPAFAQSSWTLAPFLRISGGYEDNLLLDPTGAAVVVPGGTFFDISPGFNLRHQPSENLNLQLGTRATAERFFNEVDRTLYGQVAWGDLFLSLSRRTRLRFSLSGNYFNDTQQSNLRRYGGGAEVGIDYLANRWRIEGFVGGRGVSYPRADALDDTGQITNYREARWNVGANLSLIPLKRFLLRASAVGRSTNSIDPQFDGGALLTNFSLRWTMLRRLYLDLRYGRQDRNFINRSAGIDRDEYVQWGTGLGYEMSPGLDLTLRWSDGIYTDPNGVDQDTNRIELSLNLGPSIFGTSTTPVLSGPVDHGEERSLGSSQTEDGTVFRYNAPQASTVMVVGDFNAWKPGKDLLHKTGDGWWQLVQKIPPGIYQYVYLVDGKMVTPPESSITVDDGFGNRNGWFEVR